MALLASGSGLHDAEELFTIFQCSAAGQSVAAALPPQCLYPVCSLYKQRPLVFTIFCILCCYLIKTKILYDTVLLQLTTFINDNYLFFFSQSEH